MLLWKKYLLHEKAWGRGEQFQALRGQNSVYIVCESECRCGRELPKLSQCHQRPWLFKIIYLQLSYYSCTIQSPFENEAIASWCSKEAIIPWQKNITKNMSVFRERHYCIMSSFCTSVRLFLPLV